MRTVYVGIVGVLWCARAVSGQPAPSPASAPDDRAWTVGAAAAGAAGASDRDPDTPPARSIAELRFRVAEGDLVYVVDGSGGETRGRIADLSGSTVTMFVDGKRRELSGGDLARIERRPRDPVRNGVLIGGGTGALLGFALGRSADSPSCPHRGSECGQGGLVGGVGGAFWGAVGGRIADALIRKREVIYLAPTLSSAVR